MQTQTFPKTKVTTYMDTNFYYEVKKRALEKRQTISDYFYKLAKEDIMIPVETKTKRKKSSFDKLCPGFNLGPIKGILSREEIYDYDFV